MQVKVKIKDRRSEWVEEFYVPKGQDVEKHIKHIVEEFNRTLRPGENPREFVGIFKTKEYSEFTDMELRIELEKMFYLFPIQLNRFKFDMIRGEDVGIIKEHLRRNKGKGLLWFLDYIYTVATILVPPELFELAREIGKRKWKRLPRKEAKK